MPNPDSTTNTHRSGGADLTTGRDINIGGDVVGRGPGTPTEQIDTGSGEGIRIKEDVPPIDI